MNTQKKDPPVILVVSGLLGGMSLGARWGFIGMIIGGVAGLLLGYGVMRSRERSQG